jgi:hypothetical protein
MGVTQTFCNGGYTDSATVSRGQLDATDDTTWKDPFLCDEAPNIT